jgi:hypothetical protein
MTASFTHRRRFLKATCLGFGGAVVGSRVSAVESAACTDVPAARIVSVGPGQKFSSDGKVQRYPGNTVICHIPRPGACFDELGKTYATLRREIGSEVARKFTWLPPDSYHVTIFDGVTNAFRLPGDWPQMLPLDASMDVCDQYVGERLRTLTLGFDPPLRLVIDEGAIAGSLGTVPLRPIDEAENARLRDLRDRISAATGVRHAGHDSYRFHTSFAYYVSQFKPQEEKDYRAKFVNSVRRLRDAVPVLELGAPEYCLFEDMFAFHRQFFIKSR